MLATVNPNTFPFDLSDTIKFAFCMSGRKVVQVKHAI